MHRTKNTIFQTIVTRAFSQETRSFSEISFIHDYPSRQLAYRASTKLLHPCLSLDSLWVVPQLWFTFFVYFSCISLLYHRMSNIVEFVGSLFVCKHFSSSGQAALKMKTDWIKASHFSGHFCGSYKSTFC